MISLILLFIAGICNAIMDVLDFHYNTSIFFNCNNQQWINPSISWKNKWKNGDPTQGEKFLGSSTVFVFITDLWHFCKFLMLLLMISAIVLYSPIIIWWIDLIIFYCVFTLTFEIFYSKVFNK
jgi:hypothetical protein